MDKSDLGWAVVGSSMRDVLDIIDKALPEYGAISGKPLFLVVSL